MGWVETLPSGRFRAIAWNATREKREVVPSPHRRRTWDTYIEADAAWRRHEGEIDGIYTDAGVTVERQRRRVTFAEFAETWEKIQSGEKHTRLNIHNAVKRLNQHFGDYRIDEITSLDVRAFFADRQREGYAASTRHSWHVRFRQIMQTAVDEKYRDDNPVFGVRIERVAFREPRILSDDEFLHVVSFLPGRLRAGAVLAYDCGLRAAEVSGLRWMRVTLNSPEPTVYVADVLEPDLTLREYTKGKNPEVLPLTDRAAERLRTLAAAQTTTPSGYVFTTNSGKPVHPSYLSQIWTRAYKRSGLDDPRVSFHHLRHAAATNLARAGAPAPVIQAMLRHGDLSTSQRYIEKVSLDQQRQWMSRVRQPIAPVRELPGMNVSSETGDSREDAS